MPFAVTLADSLLQDYGSNMLSKKKTQFAGNSRENCTRHARLMIASGTLAASQQSLLHSLSGQLGNAQKMKRISASSRQKAKPLIIHLFPISLLLR